MPIAELDCVSKIYGAGEQSVHALRDVSLSLYSGEMVAIMGASGSGKSTALNLLGTLDVPTSGQYRLDGQPVESLSDDDLSAVRNAKIGFVFQSFNLLPRDTALQNVELPMIYAGVGAKERRERALAALERVGLSGRATHRPAELSGGQQQRVSIARALVQRPVLLLADEPTGALDSVTTHEVMSLFVGLHEQGITVVLVTHEADVARYADRVVTFQDGSVVEDRRAA
jgi:putative ABC transport system ATP-binding protein